MAVQGVHTTTSGQPLEAMATSPAHNQRGGQQVVYKSARKPCVAASLGDQASAFEAPR